MRDRSRRKRYVLLSGDGPADAETRKELVRLVLQRQPGVDPKKTVWVGDSLIIRTDQLTLPEIKAGLAVKYGGVTLKSSLSSGSISKLKRAALGR